MKDFIVVPTYNERQNIEKLITKIFAAVPEAYVLVVDDNSPDGTQDVVREIAAHNNHVILYPHNQKAGFAKAYVDGFRKLLDEERDLRSITMMDGDLSHDPAYLPTFWPMLDTHDLIVGSRYVAGGGLVGWEWWRKLLSHFGNVYLRGVSGMKIGDITGGFNIIKADVLRRIDLSDQTARGYAFQFVLKHKLVAAGARWQEMPIIFHNRLEGESKLTHHIISEALITPWKLRFKSKT